MGQDDGSSNPYYFKETSSRKLCWLVTTWPTNRPLKVPMEAIEVLETPQKPAYGCPKYWRQTMSRYAKEPKIWPRDEKGRFVPRPLRAETEDE